MRFFLNTAIFGFFFASGSGIIDFPLKAQARPTSEVPAKHSESKFREKKSKESKTDPHWSRLIKILSQADAVDREAWWVLTGQRPPLTKSGFGKIQRAAMSENGQKLTQKSLFGCDRYQTQRKILKITSYPQEMSFFEACQKNQSKDVFAEVRWPEKRKIEITLIPQQLSDVLGLGTSILGKKINCRLETSDSGVLEKMSCQNMARDRSPTETLELSVYEFNKENKNQLSLKGQIFEQLKPKKKVEMNVPLSGKIIVEETELHPPPGYRKPGDKTTVNSQNQSPATSPQIQTSPNSSRPSSQSTASPRPENLRPQPIQRKPRESRGGDFNSPATGAQGSVPPYQGGEEDLRPREESSGDSPDEIHRRLQERAEEEMRHRSGEISPSQSDPSSGGVPVTGEPEYIEEGGDGQPRDPGISPGMGSTETGSPEMGPPENPRPLIIPQTPPSNR